MHYSAFFLRAFLKIFILSRYFAHVTVFSCCTFSGFAISMLRFYSCCTLFLFHSLILFFYRVTLFLCLHFSFFALQFLYVAHFLCCNVPYCTLFMLHYFFFYFSSFFVLNFNVLLFTCFIDFMRCYFYAVLCCVTLFSCCTFFILHYFHVAFFP